MKVLLVDPPHEIFKFFRGRMPSPSLTALSAYIENDFEMRVIDCTVQDEPWAALEAKIRSFKPQVVGISAISTSYIYDAMNAAYLVKQIDPSIVTVGGGVHMSLMPEESLEKCPSMDYIVMGEGEVTLMEFLKAIESGRTDLENIPGLAFRKDGAYHIGERRQYIADLDTLPLPGYHHFPMHKYMMPSLGMATHNSIVLTTARGCEGVCNYCSEAKLWRSTWRPKSAPRVLEEMELLYKKYDKYSFMFGDDSFNWDRGRVEDFIIELEKKKLPVHFWFQTRAETAKDPDYQVFLSKITMKDVALFYARHPDRLGAPQPAQPFQQAAQHLARARSHVERQGDGDEQRDAEKRHDTGPLTLEGHALPTAPLHNSHTSSVRLPARIGGMLTLQPVRQLRASTFWRRCPSPRCATP